MFAKPVAVDREAQPSGSKQQQMRGLMAVAPVNFRNLIDKNQRPIIRWRQRLRTSVMMKDAAGRLRKHHPYLMSEKMAAASSKVSAKPQQQELAASNPLRFLQEDCPEDVLPLVLAYAGPQTAAVLQRTNRHWKNIMAEEATWKVLCKELYKWKEGDAEPISWKRLYRTSPCVPVDYPTVEAAMRLANAPISSRRQPQPPRQVRSIRILLRPGVYPLSEGLHIQAPAGVSVTVESIALPEKVRWYKSTAPPPPAEEAVERPAAAASMRSPVTRSLFQMLRCATRSDFATGAGEEPTENCSVSDEGSHSNHQFDEEAVYPMVPMVPPKRATVVLRSKRNNEPMVRVRQGQVNLKNIDLEHSCYGLDIWNGNAAVQVQPYPLEDEEATPLPAALRPRASLENCRVQSKSGRGVVNIDGGHVDVNSCFIAGCAATGLYVGGPGSSATVHRTDVYHNGRGNPRRRGIARGHSGVYLEQGKATLDECLVAANTLTGISAVSYEKAFLTLTNSTVAQNGTHQMELPPLGTNARSQSFIDNNDLEATQLQSRSGLWKSV